MLTWNVTYHCKPGRREAFYQAVTDLGVRANSPGAGARSRHYTTITDAQDPTRRRRRRFGDAGVSSGPLSDGTSVKLQAEGDCRHDKFTITGGATGSRPFQPQSASSRSPGVWDR